MTSRRLYQLLSPVMKAENLDIPSGMVNDLIFRLMFTEGDTSVSRIADVLGINARVIDDLLNRMKTEHLVEVTKAGALGSLSFTYDLTEAGTKRARAAFERSQYIGKAPVSLESYNEAVMEQTITTRQITPAQMKKALAHLILPDDFHLRVGPAVNAGTSLFLYGPPGNGKTTIAQAIAKMLSAEEPIWLPEAITVGGQIIRIYDPLYHVPIDDDKITIHSSLLERQGGTNKLKMDHRWRLFKRPAVMVGGELTIDALDLRFEPVAKVYEAPLQLKANGGMFLIDDFGRQLMSPQQLLNRWIVPLESKIDFLRLQSGQTLEVPFQQMIVFSTNLDPTELVDGAFLRRIQMKVEVGNPDPKLFYQIFAMACEDYKVPFDRPTFIHLMQRWYQDTGRPMQAVHPRDLVKTAVSICEYEGKPPKLSPRLIDAACRGYFVDNAKHRPVANGSRSRSNGGNR